MNSRTAIIITIILTVVFHGAIMAWAKAEVIANACYKCCVYVNVRLLKAFIEVDPVITLLKYIRFYLLTT